ncbi:glutaredoxin family protein [Undibacterium terreum]|uniref:Glutaredoxin n=1 Tax=Undibacterium terreum TaxID=1224302 RepID=A0A916XIS1_9BURK|nr:glutaredoxin family protein [Undibacterium terreum]GGC76351.1 hypothetical protein GCM10011396_24510 [Undibacterium terreum]
MKKSRTSRTSHFSLLLLSAGMLLALDASAQMYKSVGPDGKVTYSDVPPPPSVKKVELKPIGGGAEISTNNFPADLAAAVSKSPVSFYTTTTCTVCGEARNMLKAAGIPFVEKTVKTNEDIEKLKQVSGGGMLPVLVVGSKKMAGYESGEWRTTLTSAGYPASNRLPKDYRYPAAEPAAPPPPPAAKPAEAAAPATNTPAASGASASGFRF